jgi:hypothetical protein
MPARAKLPKGKGKRVPLNMRTTQETRDRLEKAAADSGRSLVQEVEYRLERSFMEEDQRVREFGDQRAQLLWRLCSAVKEIVERETGKDAFDDYETSVAARAAIVKVLDGFLTLLPPTELMEAKAKHEIAVQEYEASLPKNRLAILVGRVDAPPPPKSPEDPGFRSKLMGEIAGESLVKACDDIIAEWEAAEKTKKAKEG